MYASYVLTAIVGATKSICGCITWPQWLRKDEGETKTWILWIYDCEGLENWGGDVTFVRQCMALRLSKQINTIELVAHVERPDTPFLKYLLSLCNLNWFHKFTKKRNFPLNNYNPIMSITFKSTINSSRKKSKIPHKSLSHPSNNSIRDS